MTSRRSFLKALALAAGGATIASKAVSAILTLPARKNSLQRIPDAQYGHPDEFPWSATWDSTNQIHSRVLIEGVDVWRDELGYATFRRSPWADLL